ncbi:MAG TPA: carboxypeptidase-like regulatory domain-containing protein, partial [Candidatus Limnocylindria bacterium]|nr:carboxypeptidase-like regulatory domain-containing protein [Candidatus Limnocylindria bacterium]
RNGRQVEGPGFFGSRIGRLFLFLIFAAVGVGRGLVVEAEMPLTWIRTVLEDVGPTVKKALIAQGLLSEPGFEKNLLLSFTAADTGQALTNAIVSAHALQGEVWADAKILVAKTGGWLVLYPDGATGLQVEVEVEGYAATRLSWDTRRNRPMPKSYRLRLARAVSIGGTVIDAKGNPVADARIDFRHDSGLGLVPDTVESHDFGFIRRASDSKGLWQINCIGEDMIGLIYGNAWHADHIQSEPVQVAKDSTEEKSLRAGTYVFRLRPAFDIVCRVSDTNGTPISKAEVTAFLLPYSDRKADTLTNDTFVFRRAAAGEYEFEAKAPGFAGIVFRTNIEETTGPVRLVVTRGEFVRLRVVDKGGKPIAGADAGADLTRSRLLDNRWLRGGIASPQGHLRSDAQGKIEWQTTSGAELYFDISAEGFMEHRGARAFSGGPEETVVLAPALVVTGAVTDGANGKALQRFQVRSGYAEVDSKTGATNFVWDRSDSSESNFTQGDYRRSFDHSAVWSSSSVGAMLKFSAEGYIPVLSRAIADDEGEVRMDVVLQRAAAKQISILLPNGKPAGRVWVDRVDKGRQMELGDREITSNQSLGRIQADRKGRFDLLPDDSMAAVAVAVPEGFAIASPGELSPRTPWRLQAWGRIEGVWWSGRSPVMGRDLRLEGLKGWDVLALDCREFVRRTASNGVFVFPYVPPGVIKFGRAVPHFNQISELDVRPGETAKVEIGRKGCQIVGKLALPEGDKLASYKIFASGQTPYPAALEKILDDFEAVRQFNASPEGVEFNKVRRSFDLYVDRLGNLATEEVEPGEYVVSVAGIREDVQLARRSEFLLRALPRTIIVPTSQSTTSIDLGDIKLEKAGNTKPPLPVPGRNGK